MRRWVIPILYWIAVGMLAVGAVVLVADGDDPHLDHVGEIVAGLAWPVAAVGALLDTIRHQRREDAAERRADATGRSGRSGPPTGLAAETPGLRSDG